MASSDTIAVAGYQRSNMILPSLRKKLFFVLFLVRFGKLYFCISPFLEKEFVFTEEFK